MNCAIKMFNGLLLLGLTGCFKVQVNSGMKAESAAHLEHQWFLLYGTIPVGPEIGEQCEDKGLANTTTSMEVDDVLVNAAATIGMTIALQYAVCGGWGQNECTQTIGDSFLLSTLVNRRSVIYQCLDLDAIDFNKTVK